MFSWSDDRKGFIKTCQRAFLLGMQVSTGGNISLRLKENLFLAKPSGVSLFDLKEEDLLVVDDSGKVVEGDGKPTKDLDCHLNIYRVRKDVGGVVHYHSPYSTAFAIRGRGIPLKTVHSKRILGKTPVIPPEKDGSDALAYWVGKTFSDPTIHVAILSGHGIISAGTDLRHAQNLAELLEETARIAYLSQFIDQKGENGTLGKP